MLFPFASVHPFESLPRDVGSDPWIKFDQHATARTAIFRIRCENRLTRRAATCERIEDDRVFVRRNLNYSPNETSWLWSYEHRRRIGKVANRDKFLLRLLRVSNGSMSPQRVRYYTLFHFRQETFNSRHIVPVFSPPNPIVSVQSLEFGLGISPICAGRWMRNHPAGRTSDRVGSLAVVIPCRAVSGGPRPAQVVVWILVSLILGFCSWNQVRRPFIRMLRIHNDIVVTFGKVLC